MMTVKGMMLPELCSVKPVQLCTVALLYSSPQGEEDTQISARLKSKMR